MLNQDPHFKIHPILRLAGMNSVMSQYRNTTSDLWRNFMSKRSAKGLVAGSSLYSLQVYEDDYFKNFDPDRSFVKWALIELNNLKHMPDDFELFELPAGLYAVFEYQGESRNAPEVYKYIFTTWLPSSGYELDNRPHFEKFGMHYNPADSAAEETIWIPVRLKESNS